MRSKISALLIILLQNFVFTEESCLDPGVVPHGWRRPAFNSHFWWKIGSVIEYSCNAGYALSGYRTRRCLKTGWFPPHTPYCVPGHKTVNLVGCQKPILFHGEIQPSLKTEHYSPHAVINVICNHGYHVNFNESARFICGSDNMWSLFGSSDVKILPVCQLSGCVSYPIVSQSLTIIHKSEASFSLSTPIYPLGATLQYTCKIGYQSQSSSTAESANPGLATCLYGKWKGPSLVCVSNFKRTNCSAPVRIANTEQTVYSTSGTFSPVVGSSPDRTYTPGSMIFYRCTQGVLVRGSQRRVCQADGTWSGERLVCSSNLLGCLQPPRLEHGNYYFVGLVARYYCDPGYQFSPKDTGYIQCSHGRWSNPTPLCLKMAVEHRCMAPREIANGFWSTDTPNYRVGTHIRFECDENYSLDGPSSINCLRNGAWSHLPPRCVRHCLLPDNFKNGYFKRIGTAIKYSCDPGYRLEGDGFQKCVSGSGWVGVQPNCVYEASIPSGTFKSLPHNIVNVVIATSCTLLAVLIILLAFVALRRRHASACNSQQNSASSTSRETASTTAPATLPHDSELLPEEHDRLALIAFAEGLQVQLPSYDEAIRERPPQPPPPLPHNGSRLPPQNCNLLLEFYPAPSRPTNSAPRAINGGDAPSFIQRLCSNHLSTHSPIQAQRSDTAVTNRNTAGPTVQPSVSEESGSTRRSEMNSTSDSVNHTTTSSPKETVTESTPVNSQSEDDAPLLNNIEVATDQNEVRA